MNARLLSLAAWLARRLPEPVKRGLYHLGPLTGWLRAGLNRAAPAGVSQVQVAAGGLAGAALALDLHREKDYWLGTYETDLQAAIRAWVQPGWTAYDVGANIGYVSLLLARAVGAGGQVHAFEALPANLERLRRNLALNPGGAPVQVTSAAVIDRRGPARFLVGPSGGMGKAEGSAGRQAAYEQAIEVPGLALDDYVYADGNPPPQVVKIDIEGGEVLALPGMRRLLREARPLIFLELHGPQAARSAWEILAAEGYRLRRMQAGYPAVASLDALDWKAYLVADHPG